MVRVFGYVGAQGLTLSVRNRNPKPEGSRGLAVDLTPIKFGDPGVRFVTVPGTNAREAALVVETASGTTLVVNDLSGKVGSRPGLVGWLFKVVGMTDNEPRIPFVVERREIKDRNLLRAQLEAWASSAGSIGSSSPSPHAPEPLRACCPVG